MARLAIALIVVTLIVLMLGALAAALRPVESAVSQGARAVQKGPQMPGSFRTVSYILLVILMIGVSSGFVGSI